MTSRSSIPMITKYELAALLSERAAEIANGEPITIKNPGTTNPIEIARMEFEQGRSPKKIQREYPDGTVEVWALNSMKHMINI